MRNKAKALSITNTKIYTMKTDNTIIAAFMGLRIKHPKYDTDWNWLMPVVKKIESLGYRVTIVRHICRIDLTEESKLIISEDIKKIEAVYSACLEFIKWYNKQNQ